MLTTRKPGCYYAMALGFWLATGCVHIHHEGDAKTARDAVERFAKFREPSTSIYARMQQNVEVTRRLASEQIDESIATEHATFVLRLSTMRWDAIKDELGKELKAREALSSRITGLLDQTLQDAGLVATGIVDAQAALATAKQKVKAASGEERLWKGRRVLLQEALKLAVKEEDLDAEALAAIGKEVFKKEVPGETQNGKPATVEDVLKGELKTFGDQPFAHTLAAYTYRTCLAR